MSAFETKADPDLARKLGAKTLHEWIRETGELPPREALIIDGDFLWWMGDSIGLKAEKRGK